MWSWPWVTEGSYPTMLEMLASTPTIGSTCSELVWDASPDIHQPKSSLTVRDAGVQQDAVPFVVLPSP